MKKQLFTALSALVLGTSVAQTQFLEKTCYRGAFAPAPTPMWTEGWTEWDPENAVYPATNFTVNANITANTTWTTGQVINMQGLVFVESPAELTIQPGVIIRSNPNTMSALIVTRGAKIHAVGTAAQPIVFTSNEPAGFTGGVANRAPGDFGGVILLGKAANNQPNGEAFIEGFSTQTYSVLGQHGGGASPDNNDNSGELKYVRIEFAGKEYTPNNELNSLTMGSVGRGTQIDYVQTSFGYDDAFEWFGGTVNAKHLVAFRCSDDDFDTDFGYQGTVQFALGVRDPELVDFLPGGTSEGFECDNEAAGSSNTITPRTQAVFSNVTHIGPEAIAAVTGQTVHANHQRAARLRRNSAMRIVNSVFIGHRVGGVFIDGTLSQNNAITGDLVFANNIVAQTPVAAISNTSGATSGVAGSSTANVLANGTTINAWFAAGSNTFITSGAGIVTAISYTAGDYRPAANSPALSDVSFANTYVAPVTKTSGSSSVTATIPSSVCIGDVTITPLVFTPTVNAVSAAGFCSYAWSASSGVSISNSTAVNPTFSITTVGSFSITLTATDGYGNVSSQPQTIVTYTCGDVGIAEGEFTLGRVSVYPNPASDVVTVSVAAEKVASSLSIAVYDITGKVVAAPVLNASLVSGDNTFTINTSELNNGIYFVTLNSSNGKGTVKLVVNK